MRIVIPEARANSESSCHQFYLFCLVSYRRRHGLLVAMLFAQFASKHDSGAERCWIAEVNCERAGCVFVVRNTEDATAAQLRCLLVDRVYRGLGIGSRLVDECLKFARHAGYRKMVLWTNDVLSSARRIYERAGFQLIDEDRHESFDKGLVGQTWMRELWYFLSTCAPAADTPVNASFRLGGV